MVKRIGIIIVGATLVVAHCLIGGAAFAATQENGQPCPPECVTDSMEIMTWYPSPWNSYEELYTMKLGVGDVTTFTEAELKPNKVGSIKVSESVVFKPKGNDPDSWYSGDAEAGELVYSSQKDAFYHYNGSSWVPQTGGSGKTVVAFTCLWRYDYRETPVGIGPVPLSGAGSWGCAPQACPTSSGWSQLGDVFNDQVALACGGAAHCHWAIADTGASANTYPVSAGRSVRLCVSQ